MFGAQYASDLHTLFWEFLCRLAQLLPVPDLEQVSIIVSKEELTTELLQLLKISKKAHILIKLYHPT